MPGTRGRQPGQKIASRMLGTVGVPSLQKMIGALVRSLAEPGLSAAMKLKLVRQVNELRGDLAKCRIEAARRKADILLAETPSMPNGASVSKVSEGVPSKKT